jgi:hypothetical protein
LLPGGSELVLYTVVKLHPEQYRSALAVAALGNALGGMLPLVQPGVAVDFVLQELGTYPPFAVFHALREKNRWHHYGNGSLDHPAKQRLLEALCTGRAPVARAGRGEGAGLVRAAADWTFQNGEQ